jgi:uncharacterized glyoxalase superfamily protein PhnB
MITSAIPVLAVADSARAEDYYCRVLGFQKVFAYRPDPARSDPCYLGVSRNGVTLHLDSFKPERAGATNAYLYVTDVDRFHVAISARGAICQLPPTDQSWGNRETHIRDPDGNVLCFAQNRQSRTTSVPLFRRKATESLEAAAAKPAAVRRLHLNRPGVTLEAFTALLPQLTKVREIQIGWQTWTELPHGLSALRELRVLHVLNTPIKLFPEFLADCPHFKELILRGTAITSLPASIQNFRQLRIFDFSNNPVREIPSEIGKLSKLRELQLADNQLKTLPVSIAGLRRLTTLALAGNRFSAAEASRIRNWFRPGIVSVWSNEAAS